MKPFSMTRVVDRLRYSTATATLLCGNAYWDGHNHERSGRNTFLYRTPKGNYFFVHQTQWQGERDRLVPCTPVEAVTFYESVPENEHEVEYAEAFPDVTVEEA